MRSLIAKLAEGILLFLLSLYQRVLSPALHAFAGPGYGCRFEPSCSQYARVAVKTHGPLRGAGMAAGRVLRCHPGSVGGWDPVRAKR